MSDPLSGYISLGSSHRCRWDTKRPHPAGRCTHGPIFALLPAFPIQAYPKNQSRIFADGFMAHKSLNLWSSAYGDQPANSHQVLSLSYSGRS